MSSEPLTKEQIEAIVNDRLGIEEKFYPVPGKIYGNVADYQTEPLNNYPYLYNARYYAQTRFGRVDLYLTFENEIRSTGYDGGIYRRDGSHYIVLLENEETVK